MVDSLSHLLNCSWGNSDLVQIWSSTFVVFFHIWCLVLCCACLVHVPLLIVRMVIHLMAVHQAVKVNQVQVQVMMMILPMHLIQVQAQILMIVTQTAQLITPNQKTNQKDRKDQKEKI